MDDASIWAIPCDVSRSIESGEGFWRKGMRDERSFVNSAPSIATGQPMAADIELTGHADGNRLEELIENIHLRVGDRFSPIVISRSGPSTFSIVDQIVVSVGPYMFTRRGSAPTVLLPDQEADPLPPQRTVKFCCLAIQPPPTCACRRSRLHDRRLNGFTEIT